MLLMTLLLPSLDQARSYRLLMDRVSRHVPAGACVQSPGASVGLMTALSYFGHHQVTVKAKSTCQYLVKPLDKQDAVPNEPGWTFVARVYQRNMRSESVAIYRR